MAINFPDSPSNGDTFTANGKTFVYNSTNTSWRPQTAAESGGTDVLTNMAALIAKTGMSNGDQALVQSTNNLYMYSGSGWYKIATIQNDAPSAITGVDGSYALAMDGTSTTITAVSTDPEGFTLTWSYTASGLGSIATVSQVDNVFTVTPSTDAANAGSFTLTISATDGINGAVSTVPSFTLAFIVTNSRYTSLSVKATNTGSNQTFDDVSTSNHTITVAGDATASTFSPHRHGGYSAYFDGTDNLSVADNSAFDIGASDFTAECWIYPTGSPSQPVIFGQWDSLYSWAILLSNDSNRYARMIFNGLDNFRDGVSSTVVPLNAWSHMAVVKDGSNATLYVNGNSAATVDTIGDLPDTNIPLTIGDSNATAGFQGYVADARFVVGSKLYTTNFTPPTTPLTPITNTKFLLGQLPYFKDQSTSNHAITINGNVSSKPISVFDNVSYSEASHGASIYFDGTDDNISVANHADFNVGSSDFTLECWAYIESINGNAGLCGLYNTSTNQRSYLIYQTDSSEHFGVAMSSDGTYQSGSGIDSNVNIIEYLNQWVHLALTKSGTNATLYLNGNSIGTTSSAPSTLHASTASFVVGKTNGINTHTTGYFSDVRLVNGSVVYSSNFTPPTAPLTAITNTKFLLNPETSISDLSQKHAIKCVADAATSTTQVKFAGTKSIYLDGTGDYISIKPILEIGEKSWTFETWVYVTSTGSMQHLFSRGVGNSTTVASLSINANGIPFVNIWDGSSDRILSSGSAGDITANTWHHVVLTHTYTSSTSNTYKIWVDGSQVTSITHTGGFNWSWSTLSGTPLLIGAYGYNNGSTAEMYLQDSRLTIGLVRYTSTFTPPTAELEG